MELEPKSIMLLAGADLLRNRNGEVRTGQNAGRQTSRVTLTR